MRTAERLRDQDLQGLPRQSAARIAESPFDLGIGERDYARFIDDHDAARRGLDDDSALLLLDLLARDVL